MSKQDLYRLNAAQQLENIELRTRLQSIRFAYETGQNRDPILGLVWEELLHDTK